MEFNKLSSTANFSKCSDQAPIFVTHFQTLITNLKNRKLGFSKPNYHFSSLISTLSRENYFPQQQFCKICSFDRNLSPKWWQTEAFPTIYYILKQFITYTVYIIYVYLKLTIKCNSFHLLNV